MASKKLDYTDFLDAMSSNKKGGGYLEGQLLIAMPSMFDPNFERTVIYICAHSDQGAVGLTINRPIETLSFPELLSQLEIPAVDPPGNQMILIGGPVETERGFVLHSVDYFTEDATLRTSEEIGLTATLDILRAIAQGKGPRQKLLAIGYAGWAPGQLEAEIQANGWLHCDADEAIVFDDQYETKWDRAIAKLGVEPSQLSSDFGHA
jgi:putative transcriptional regulator